MNVSSGYSRYVARISSGLVSATAGDVCEGGIPCFCHYSCCSGRMVAKGSHAGRGGERLVFLLLSPHQVQLHKVWLQGILPLLKCPPFCQAEEGGGGSSDRGRILSSCCHRLWSYTQGWKEMSRKTHLSPSLTATEQQLWSLSPSCSPENLIGRSTYSPIRCRGRGPLRWPLALT